MDHGWKQTELKIEVHNHQSYKLVSQSPGECAKSVFKGGRSHKHQSVIISYQIVYAQLILQSHTMGFLIATMFLISAFGAVWDPVTKLVRTDEDVRARTLGTIISTASIVLLRIKVVGFVDLLLVHGFKIIFVSLVHFMFIFMVLLFRRGLVILLVYMRLHIESSLYGLILKLVLLNIVILFFLVQMWNIFADLLLIFLRYLLKI